MVSTALAAMGTQSVVDELASDATARSWLMPAPGRVDHGLFERALRAAAIVWHPDWFDMSPQPTKGGHMVLPDVLEAWRATERDLAGLAVDSPHQELLEANATMLRAMYQRLYLERTSR
jgi:hypothetical protein